MKSRAVQIAIILALAAAGLVYWLSQPSKWEAAVARCNDGGDGDMFTSQQLCEARYDRKTGERVPQRNSN